MKILAIDDNQDNLISLKALMRETFPDALTLTAMNGQCGLDLAAAEDPDVILLDIVMPGMDGFEICKKLKSDKILSDIPVVFVTALKGDKESRVCALECGADAFLSKPVDEIELTAQIRAMVKIKISNMEKRDEKKRLADIVDDQIRELKETHSATLNLMEDLRKENEAKKKSEEALRESEKRYRQIFESSYDAILVQDISSGSILDVNQRMMEMYGLADKREALKCTINELSACEEGYDESRIRDMNKKAVDSNMNSFEWRARKKNGEVFWVQVTLRKTRIGDEDRIMFSVSDISARKRVESALLEREEMFRALVQSLPDIVARFDREGRHLFVSDNVTEAVGLVPSQIIGKTNRELGFPEELCQLCEKGIKRVLNNGMCFESEFSFGTKDGQRINNLRLVPERDESGAIRSVLAISRDITEHRRAEDNYQTLFREMLDGFALHEIVCDETGKPVDYRFLAINPAFERITGLKAQEVMGKTVLEVMPNTERHWIETYGEVALTGQPAFFENYAVDLKKYFEVTAFRPSTNKFACIFTDITERKLAECRRVFSAEILTILNKPVALQDMIRDVISAIKKYTGFDAVGIRLKSDGDFPYFSHNGFSNDFLLSEGTLLERDMSGGVCRDKDGNPCLKCTCGLVISGKTDPANSLFTPGGSFWTNNSFSLLQLPADLDPRLHPRNRCIHDGFGSFALIPILANQEIVGLLQLNNREKDSLTLDMIHFFEGLSANIGIALMQKEAEQEKAKLELQLRESQKMQAVGQLAGGISHDFNNLLSVINGYAQMLLKDPGLKSSTARPKIEEILKAGELASSLTRQLLVFSRGQPMEHKIIDLNAIVSGMHKMLRRIVKESIEIVLECEPKLWHVKSDPGQLEQVIMNLVVNSRDAMPKGGALTIRTENVKINEASRTGHPEDIRTGLYVMLSVRDTGDGMNDIVKEHIFEPFFTTKDIGRGTGLGLAIVYGIVKQNKAYIDVQSELGKGTMFRIYFPSVADDTLDGNEVRKLIDMPGGKETILLVEDEGVIRDLLQEFLRSVGYFVLSANSGKQALELAKGYKGQIHLLLTDVVMPGMNGFELAKQLRKTLPDVKLLFMTGYLKPSDTQGMIKMNNNLLHKPISISALAVKLREILAQ